MQITDQRIRLHQQLGLNVQSRIVQVQNRTLQTKSRPSPNGSHRLCHLWMWGTQANRAQPQDCPDLACWPCGAIIRDKLWRNRWRPQAHRLVETDAQKMVAEELTISSSTWWPAGDQQAAGKQPYNEELSVEEKLAELHSYLPNHIKPSFLQLPLVFPSISSPYNLSVSKSLLHLGLPISFALGAKKKKKTPPKTVQKKWLSGHAIGRFYQSLPYPVHTICNQ